MSQKYRVAVCRGVTCTSLFADDVYRAFRKQVERRGLGASIAVERAGCLGRCGGGATVAVRTGAEGTRLAESVSVEFVVYPELMEPEVARVVCEHLIGHAPVVELQVPRRGAKGR